MLFGKLAVLELAISNISVDCFAAMNFADRPVTVADISDTVFFEKKIALLQIF